MKLIRQANLFYREGKSDKVYEVDLCEVGGGKFVVNFRYGRRGQSLRDGTKTKASVDRSTADKIFDALVASKTAKGYRAVDADGENSSGLDVQPDASPIAVEAESDDPRIQAILNRIAKGPDPQNRWPLSRAIWRAGELRVRKAEALILPLAGHEAMIDYNIAAALSRMGSLQCVPMLQQILAKRAHPVHVRRMADEAIRAVKLSQSEDASVIESYVTRLPDWCRELATDGPGEEFGRVFAEHLAEESQEVTAAIDTLYFIDNEHVRPTLLDILRTAPLQPNYFQHLRRIFKTSELREDGEVFGILASRFEKQSHNFVMPGYYGYGYYRNEKKPTIGVDAKQAFSKQTRLYFKRRIWRTLERMGNDGNSNYCKMAAGVLLNFSDSDAAEISSYDTWSGRGVVSRKVDAFGRWWALSNILFLNSSRYLRLPSEMRFDCAEDFDPTQHSTMPTQREEAFPKLWDKVPSLLLELLCQSRLGRVHEFASLALKSNEAFCKQIDLGLLIDFLACPYEATCSFALDAVVDRYDSSNLDRQLVLALANCALGKARQQAIQWIQQRRNFFFDDEDFSLAVITSSYADIRALARSSLRIAPPYGAAASSLGDRIISHMLTLGEGDDEAAIDIGDTFALVLSDAMRSVPFDTIRSLLEHSLEGVQRFGAEALLKHPTLSKRPPAELLDAMLRSEFASVRSGGTRLVEGLSDSELLQSEDLLFVLIRHPRADVRNEIRPVLRRLVQRDSSFGQKFADRLIEALLSPGAAEGVPTHTAQVLIEDLESCLTKVSASTVWQLLQSRSAPAQDVGGLLMPTNMNADSISVEKLVRLASHDVLRVREGCWQLCRDHVDRLRGAMSSAVRLLDAKWEDSRAFGFELFRDSFEESDLTAEVLVSICDSVREDVQQFGCQLITKRFESDDGQEYLLKLSEHPSTTLQLFATNFLDRYAVDNPQRLEQLKPYFMSVLTRVNRGRTAKDRVLALLDREANKSEQAARVVVDVVTEISATASVGDRASTIELMLKLNESYPELSLPMQIQPVEVR